MVIVYKYENVEIQWKSKKQEIKVKKTQKNKNNKTEVVVGICL